MASEFGISSLKIYATENRFFLWNLAFQMVLYQSVEVRATEVGCEKFAKYTLDLVHPN